MYNTTNTNVKKLTAFRIDELTTARLKTKARMENISVNALVNRVLTELVKDVKSDDEIAAAKKETEEFITNFSGAWSGPEYEDIEANIMETRTTREPVEL